MLRKTTDAYRAPYVGRLGKWLWFRAGLIPASALHGNRHSNTCHCSILKKLEVMDEDNIDEWANEAEDSREKKGGGIRKLYKYTSSNHITFSSISLLAPGRFRGLREPGVSLDWNGEESNLVTRQDRKFGAANQTPSGPGKGRPLLQTGGQLASKSRPESRWGLC